LVATRTIFLFVRGYDQSGRAFRSIDRNMEKMIRREMEATDVTRAEAKKRIRGLLDQMEATQRLSDASYRLLFAGAAFLAFGGMVAIGLGKIIGTSKTGQLYVEDFQTAITNLSVALSEAVITYWGPSISGFIDWLDNLGRNETFKWLFGEAAVPVVISLGVMAVELFVLAAITKLGSSIADLLTTAGYLGLAGKVTWATEGLLHIAIPATIVLTLAGLIWSERMVQLRFKELMGWLSEEEAEELRKLRERAAERPPSRYTLPDPAKWVNLWEWWDYVTASGGGPVLPPEPQRQLGGFIPHTGPYFLHEGEFVYNPQLPTGRPYGAGRGVAGPTMVNMTQNIDTVHTQADMEEMVDVTSKGIYDALSRSRLLGRTFVR